MAYAGMLKRFQRRKVGARKAGTGQQAKSADTAVVGFEAAVAEMVGEEGWPELGPRRGPAPRLPLRVLLLGLIYHALQRVGTVGEHLAMLTSDPLSESSCAERRQRLPWAVFEELMQRTLRPLAAPRRQRESFWRGWRVLALDGTQFSLTNTPQNLAGVPKAKSRRGQAAFGKLITGVLLEVGLHNPLAAVIGQRGESEWTLALRLLARLPRKALLLADRLHGCAAFVVEAWAVCARVGSHFLIRARTQIKARTVKRHRDGSRLIEVPVYAYVPGKARRVVQQLRLREIRVQVTRRGHRSQTVRLWTSLLDPAAAPAAELAELYTQRWEQELYYRELKRVLRKNDLLLSHTICTGAQEIAALVIASALLARERLRAANGATPVLRLSFAKTLELLRPLWLTLELGADLLSEKQKQQLTDRFLQQARCYISQPKRVRSSPRALRQPISGWPRLLHREPPLGSLRTRLV